LLETAGLKKIERNFIMKKMTQKKLRAAHSLISAFHNEIKNMVYDVPSLLQYCLENDLRHKLKENRFNETEINTILKASELNISPKKKQTNKVEFHFNFRNFDSFQNNYSI
jgi:hypothetical protein